MKPLVQGQNWKNKKKRLNFDVQLWHTHTHTHSLSSSFSMFSVLKCQKSLNANHSKPNKINHDCIFSANNLSSLFFSFFFLSLTNVPSGTETRFEFNGIAPQLSVYSPIYVPHPNHWTRWWSPEVHFKRPTTHWRKSTFDQRSSVESSHISLLLKGVHCQFHFFLCFLLPMNSLSYPFCLNSFVQVSSRMWKQFIFKKVK